MSAAGLLSLGAYLPGHALSSHLLRPAPWARFAALVQQTRLPLAYKTSLLGDRRFPGRVEGNDAWTRMPWYKSFLERLPKQGGKTRDPFQGIRERCRVPMDPESVRMSPVPFPMLSTDMETIAACTALGTHDVDMLISCSQTPDRELPPNCCLVHHKLNLPASSRMRVLSVDACCASFLTAMELAARHVQFGLARKVLITGSHCDSKIADPTSHHACITGDAAVAAVVGPVEAGHGLLGAAFSVHGERHGAVICRVGGPVLEPPGHYSDLAPRRLYREFYDRVAARAINEHTVEDISDACGRALQASGLHIAKIDRLVTHNPVHEVMEKWRSALGVLRCRYTHHFAVYGNTGLCSAPLNLYEDLRSGHAKAGDRVLAVSSGAGEQFVALVERISSQCVQSFVT